MTRHWPLVVIVSVYLIIGTLFATRIPAWQMPDEPAHYNYIKQLAERGLVPIIKPSDWPRDFQPIGPDKRDVDIAPLTYEDHQPPLYYLLQTPVYAVTHGSLTALRLVSLAFGAFTIGFIYLAVLAIFPQHAYLAAFAAAFAGLLGQHVFMLSGVNNDALAEALLACAVWQSLRLIRPSGPTRRELIALIVTIGLCLWTKVTAYLAVPIAAWALLRRPASEEGPGWGRGRALIVPAVAAFLLGLPWWVHNLQVYGGLDFLGLQRHNAVVIVSQITPAEWIQQHGLGSLLAYLLQTTFQSFWGQFGWMSVTFDKRVYIALLIDTLVSAALFMLWWLHGQSAKRRLQGEMTTKSGASVYSPYLVLTQSQSRQLTTLALLALLTLLSFIWYNLQFVQAQGRYLYSALIPISLAFALGWGFILSRREAVARWTWLVLLVALAALDVYALLRVILPAMKV